MEYFTTNICSLGCVRVLYSYLYIRTVQVLMFCIFAKIGWQNEFTSTIQIQGNLCKPCTVHRSTPWQVEWQLAAIALTRLLASQSQWARPHYLPQSVTTAPGASLLLSEHIVALHNSHFWICALLCTFVVGTLMNCSSQENCGRAEGRWVRVSSTKIFWSLWVLKGLVLELMNSTVLIGL